MRFLSGKPFRGTWTAFWDYVYTTGTDNQLFLCTFFTRNACWIKIFEYTIVKEVHLSVLNVPSVHALPLNSVSLITNVPHQMALMYSHRVRMTLKWPWLWLANRVVTSITEFEINWNQNCYWMATLNRHWQLLNCSRGREEGIIRFFSFEIADKRNISWWNDRKLFIPTGCVWDILTEVEFYWIYCSKTGIQNG